MEVTAQLLRDLFAHLVQLGHVLICVYFVREFVFANLSAPPLRDNFAHFVQLGHVVICMYFVCVLVFVFVTYFGGISDRVDRGKALSAPFKRPLCTPGSPPIKIW